MKSSERGQTLLPVNLASLELNSEGIESLISFRDRVRG
jgi:hypothetical protein